jgi:hypothetical protein
MNQVRAHSVDETPSARHLRSETAGAHQRVDSGAGSCNFRADNIVAFVQEGNV